jgi:hypothetical protein
MNKEKILLKTNWLTVKETARGFQYLERKGRDSVAVFLVRKSALDSQEYEVLIRFQPLCLDNSERNGKLQLYPCPITGGIDGDETPAEAAVREVKEESGYSVQVISLGSYIIGTQTNEICYLYYGDVTGIEPGIATLDGSYFEAISYNQWHPLEYLSKCDYSACQLGYFRLKMLFCRT